MEEKKILTKSLAGLMLIIIIGLLAASLATVTPSGTNACKESSPGNSGKASREIKNDIDFETLSGKFFSSVSY